MGYPLTCLSCQRPFPRNATLASLPLARRLAFDPVRGRVWSVCTTGGEWNILGAEAAAAVAEEAKHLLAAAPQRTVDRGIAR